MQSNHHKMLEKLSELEDIVRALRNGEVDAVIGMKNIHLVRLKDVEDRLKEQRDYLQGQLDERESELRELARRLVDAQEKERTRIGNELHDEIGQLLTYISLLLDRAIRKPDEELVREARGIVLEVISQVRDLSTMLSPRLLRTAGLQEAFFTLIDGFRQHTGVKVALEKFDDPGELLEEPALAAYRIVQEALTNITRHADATEVRFKVVRSSDRLEVEISDNGKGFDTDDLSHATGLMGMKERALSVGGDFSIESRPGQGTRLRASIPFGTAA